MTAGLTLQSIKRAMGGGVITGGQLLTAGPGHRPNDQSLSIRLSHQSPAGFLAHSFSGDDWRECRDFVASKLGLAPDVWRHRQKTNDDNIMVGFAARPEINVYNIHGDKPDNAARIARARAIFDEAGPAAGTIVEHYLTNRGVPLDLVSDPHAVIRYNPRTPWRDDATGEVIRVPAMICAMRAIADDTITAAHKTRLTPKGKKVGRKMQGQASGSAIKLSADDEVTLGLHVSEGVETALAGLLLGLRPAWALGSAGAIERFPVLGGIESLTLLAENDPTNARAVEACAERWALNGAEVNIIRSTRGNDLNDVLKPEAV